MSRGVDRIWAESELSTVGDLTDDEQADALGMLGKLEENLTRATDPEG